MQIVNKQEVDKIIIESPEKHFQICDADCGHLEGIKRLADANRHIFSFITRGAFLEAIQAGTLIVALKDNQVVGFLRYHHRKRDQQTTLYDICVIESERGKNLGQRMITTLIGRCRYVNRATILLRCPSPLRANSFYKKNGFRCIDTVAGKHHDLNIWRLDLVDGGYD